MADPGYTPRVDPQFGGSFAAGVLPGLANPLLAGQGLLPGQFRPTQNYYDRFQGGQYNQGMLQAMQQAGQQDKNTYLDTMRGLSLATTGRSWSAEQEKAAQQIANDLVKAGPMLAQLAPQTFDALHGSRGSSQVMAMNVFDASRFIRDPHSGRTGLAANQASWLNQQLYGGLYGPQADLKQMNGLGAGQAGMMFKEMTQRGMVGGQDMMTGGGMERTKEKLKNMSGAVRAMQDIFGEQGRGDAPMQEIFAGLDKVTQGGLANMSPGQIQGIVRRTHALAHLTGNSMDTMMAMSDRGAGMAQSIGLNRQFGVSTSQSSAAFGQAWTNLAGPQGFGGLNRDQATALDQRLRTAAAGSATANRMGATAKMAEAGLIPGIDLNTAGLNSSDQATRVNAEKRYITSQQRLRDLIQQSGNMSPQQWQQFMQQQGVTGGVASNYLASREANQDAILRHGLGDQVRNAQGVEVGNLMSNVLAGGSRATLGRLGMNSQATAQTSRIVGDAIRDALVGMDPTLREDPTRTAERNNVIKQRVQAALRARGISLPDASLNEMIANAVQTLDQRVRSDPKLKQFGSISGLISMNQGNVLGQGQRNLHDANAAARDASSLSGIGQGGVLSRMMDALQGAKTGDNLGTIIGKVIGGVSPEQMRDALGKPGGGGQAELGGTARPGGSGPSEFLGTKPLGGPSSTAEQATAKGGSGQSNGGNLNISGTLTLNADNTATINGTSRPGNVASP